MYLIFLFSIMFKQILKNKNFSEIKTIFRNGWRIFLIIWQEQKWLLLFTSIISICLSFLPFAESGINALFLNKIVQIVGGLTADYNFYLLLTLLVLVEVVTPVLNNYNFYLGRLLWFYEERKFQIDIIARLGSLDIAIHEDPNYKDLINKINESGVMRIQSFFERQLYILQNIAELLTASGILIYSNWWLFIVILLSAIPTLINEMQSGKSTWNIHSAKAEVKRKYQEIYWRFGLVNSLMEMKIYQNVQYFVDVIRDLYDIFQSEEIRLAKIKINFQNMASLISQISYAFAMVYFVFEVIHGRMQIGTFTFMLSSISIIRGSLSMLFYNIARQYEDNLFVTDVFKLFDVQDVILKPQPGIKLSKNITPSIEFKNVTFCYPNTKKNVLKNFSLKIQPGEKIAFVGINGAGKSTIIKLLCRLYDPTSGQILINDRDLRTINLDSWYYQLGAIFQDYEKYHFVVDEVIALGRTSRRPSLHKVKGAAKSSEADIFIQAWEAKYKQMLGKEYAGGVEPSVGQWQKIALARSFYREPHILILDEPTSSIDAQAEAKIFDKLHHLPKNRTVIIISHRFSTVRNADHICVIKDGCLLEYGTHQELLANRSTYAKLFSLQAKGYK